MSKKVIASLLLVALVSGAVAWNASREKPIEVKLISVARGEVRSTVSNTRAGTVNTCNRAHLAPITSGQIASLPVHEGDRVEAGQVLLELWNNDLRAHLHHAEEEQRASVARADQACTSAYVARREADRYQSLRDQKLTSEERADAAVGAADASGAACRAMRSMVKVAESQIEIANARLEQSIIRAPFAGTVAQINGEIGEVVTPSPVGVATLPAVDLIDSSCIYITAPIDEVDAPAIRAGMRASITLDAFPGQSFSATVRRVAPYVMAIEKQARTLDIEAEFEKPSENLLPGYSADIEITLEVSLDALYIPTQALVADDRVLILDSDGLLQERTIQTGLSNWQITEILDGLVENDKIVLSVDRKGVVVGAAAVAEDDPT